MKSSKMYMSILTIVAASTAFGADAVPARPDFNRYSGMLEKSPFAVATAVAAPAATPNFAKDLYVANAAHTETADLVTIISGSDKNFHEYLTTEKPNEHGYSISNIQWSEKQGETKVTISKDGQYATLPFNQALLVPATPMSQPATIAPPVMPTPMPNIPRPPQPPTVATPTPRTRGVIQRNPNANTGAVPTPYGPNSIEQ